MTQMVTATELAPHIGKTRGAQVLRAYRAGYIPGHRIGRRVVFDVDEVLQHIKGDQAASSPSPATQSPPRAGRRRQISLA